MNGTLVDTVLLKFTKGSTWRQHVNYTERLVHLEPKTLVLPLTC